MRDRTADLLRAKQALSQLSYSPIRVVALSICVNQGKFRSRIACYATKNLTLSGAKLVGLSGFEPPTSPLSGVRSNQLSYKPTYSASADYALFNFRSGNMCERLPELRNRLRR